MLRWIWLISEYNLKTRNSRKQTPRRVTCYIGSVEGADLKNNSQSITHIDPKVGTGGSHMCWLCLIFAHVTLSLPGGREKSGTCLQCVGQRSIWSIETQMVFQSNRMDFISWPITSLCRKTCVIPTADRNTNACKICCTTYYIDMYSTFWQMDLRLKCFGLRL